MSNQYIIENAKLLNDNDFNELLNIRKEHTFKFKQLKSDMIYLVNEGHDNFKHIIKHVDYDNKLFNFIDLSLPDFHHNFNKIQISKDSRIPYKLYENEEMFQKNIEFKFIEIDENQIMQLHNLTEFESNLYDKLHIKALKVIITTLKNKLSLIVNELDSKIYENLESNKIRNLNIKIEERENYIKKLKIKLKNQEIDFPEFEEKPIIKNKNTNKIVTLESEQEKNQKLRTTNKLLNEKVLKYRNLYFSALEKIKK